MNSNSPNATAAALTANTISADQNANCRFDHHQEPPAAAAAKKFDMVGSMPSHEINKFYMSSLLNLNSQAHGQQSVAGKNKNFVVLPI